MGGTVADSHCGPAKGDEGGDVGWVAEYSRRAGDGVDHRTAGGRTLVWVGIPNDDNPDVTAPDKCRCDVGVAVDDSFVPIGDEQVMTIPGGRYATTRFSGTPDRIHEPWQRMLRQWLPASGLQLDARPMFEYYGPGMTYDEATGAFECDITIPVRPL